MAHSLYEGSEIKGHKLKDLPFVIDDLKLMGSLDTSLLHIDGCFVIAEPSESQCNYIIVLCNELIITVEKANKNDDDLDDQIELKILFYISGHGFIDEINEGK